MIAAPLAIASWWLLWITTFGTWRFFVGGGIAVVLAWFNILELMIARRLK